MNIGKYTFEEFIDKASEFHGYPAPGLIIGGYMVELAKSRMPKGCLFEALVETPKCLPDAVQLLTLCSIGNGRLKIVNWGLYALTLYDKFSGEGCRVFIDTSRIEVWSEIKAWFLKTKPKEDQDTDRLFDEIRHAGDKICSVESVKISGRLLGRKEMGSIGICPICKEAFPEADGGICRKCQGEDPYEKPERLIEKRNGPKLFSVPVEKAVGKRTLHDMTRIVPGVSKGAAFKAGQEISAGDICRLQQMGRLHIYTDEENDPGEEWVHENTAVKDFASAIAGEGIGYDLPPKEGKISFRADMDGLFVLEKEVLEMFNLVPNVMCATRQGYSVVEKGKEVAGCRALPLYLSREDYSKAMSVLAEGPLLKVFPMRKAEVGILVTGTEIFKGLIEDKFIPIVKNKVEKLGCRVVETDIAPDDSYAISRSIEKLLSAGSELIITTAGLSVDPDDVTLDAFMNSGAEDFIYGAPILPGAMTMLATIGKAQVVGVPACALFYKTTSFDLLLPRILAGIKITRLDMARIAEGGFCLNCRSCTFPKCPFGK
ncbi:FmdE family protein [Thermodesulfobacteriota bacterium]